MTKASDERKERREVESLVKGVQKGLRTFELVQYVTGPVEGSFEDWPANIQDAILAAMDQKAADVQLPLAMVVARCDKDYDAVDPKRVWYIHVILSEVVAAIEARN